MSRDAKRQKRPQGTLDGRPSKTDRLREIVKVMSLGGWGPMSKHDYSEKWGVPMGTLDVDAAEASRIVRGAVADNDQLVEELRGVAKGRLKDVMERILDAQITGESRREAALEKSAAEYLRILLTDTRSVHKPGGSGAARKLSIPEDELKLLLGAAGYELKKVDDGGEEE